VAGLYLIPNAFSFFQVVISGYISGTVNAVVVHHTQPVNLVVNAAQEAGGHLASIDTKLTSPLAITGTFWQATQPVSVATLPLPSNAAQETGGNLASIASILEPKGTQGAEGMTVQAFKDSGRTAVVINIPEVASVTTETLLSINVMRGTTQTTSVTSYTVTTGKTLRIQAIRVKARFTTPSTTVTFAQALINLRNAAAIAAGNLLFGIRIDCAANMESPGEMLSFPDGWELPSGSIIAFSQLGSATTLTLGGELIGYEY
jgi:hypothetical protein